MPNQEHERERSNTKLLVHTLSPEGNYSLLVMDSTGMMKMATGDGFPLRQGAGTGSREIFWGLQRLAAAELPIYLDIQWF